MAIAASALGAEFTGLALGGHVPALEESDFTRRIAELEKTKSHLQQHHRNAKQREQSAIAKKAAAQHILQEAKKKQNTAAESIAATALVEAETAIARARDLIEELNRQIADTESTLESVRSAVPNLAAAPEIEPRVKLRLHKVNDRITRLRKAIEILGADNPEWEKHWSEVVRSMRADSDQLLWAGLDLLTLDLAEAAKYAHVVPAVEQVYAAEVVKLASRQKESLLRLRRSWAGESVTGWIKELEALQREVARLEKAAQARDTAEMIAIARDAIAKSQSVYHQAEKSTQSASTLNALYHASLAFGEIAVICVDGVGGKIATPANLVARSIEAALLLKLLRQGEKQLEALSDQAFDRHRKKTELMETVANLVEERSRLEWALQRSGRQ